jgi:hypothetical protein
LATPSPLPPTSAAPEVGTPSSAIRCSTAADAPPNVAGWSVRSATSRASASARVLSLSVSAYSTRSPTGAEWTVASGVAEAPARARATGPVTEIPSRRSSVAKVAAAAIAGSAARWENLELPTRPALTSRAITGATKPSRMSPPAQSGETAGAEKSESSRRRATRVRPAAFRARAVDAARVARPP